MINPTSITSSVLEAIKGRMATGAAAEGAVVDELSGIDDECIIDMVRENMGILKCDSMLAIDFLPPNSSTLDVLEYQLRAFLLQRLSEDELLEGWTPERQRFEMMYFFARLHEDFPGFKDRQSSVNGADLVDWLCDQFENVPQLKLVRRWTEWEAWERQCLEAAEGKKGASECIH